MTKLCWECKWKYGTYGWGDEFPKYPFVGWDPTYIWLGIFGYHVSFGR